MTTHTATSALPSLRNRALLVNLSFSKPPMTRLDRKATHDAEQANNAHGALKTLKALYPKTMIDPIVAHEAAMRGYLKHKTVEWGGTGLCLLDTRHFMEVADTLERMKLEHSQLVTVFAQNWSNVLYEAEKQQGALFDPTQYPDISEVVGQFSVTINYLPVGDMAGGLFDDIEKELRETIAEQVERSTKEVLSATLAEPYERLIEQLLNLHDKTAREDGRVHTSLTEGFKELVDMLPALNVLNDPGLNKLANYCRDKLTAPAEILKEKDSATRQQVAQDSAALIADMGLDPAACLELTQMERRAIARQTTQDIISKMRGFV